MSNGGRCAMVKFLLPNVFVDMFFWYNQKNNFHKVFPSSLQSIPHFTRGSTWWSEKSRLWRYSNWAGTRILQLIIQSRSAKFETWTWKIPSSGLFFFWGKNPSKIMSSTDGPSVVMLVVMRRWTNFLCWTFFFLKYKKNFLLHRMKYRSTVKKGFSQLFF